MIRAKKSYGQNFLKDVNIIDKIVNSINITEGDLVIEIGPGQGALTKRLKEKNAQIIAFEIDERMHEVLDKIEDNKTIIVYKDILNVNLNDIISNYKYNKLYVVANLPYYITTPIVEKLIDSSVRIDEMTIMVQDEVADRFCAKPGTKEYGYMTVLLNLKYNLEKLFIVRNTCFVPMPKVNSAVVNFKIKDNEIEINDYNKFVVFLKNSFAHKRKTLKNNIGNELWDKIKEHLYSLGYKESVRAEEISVEDYIEISNIISN